MASDMISRLADRVDRQNGSAVVTDEEWEEWDRESSAAERKCRWGKGAGFGSLVTVVWDDGHEDEGYLTCLPGHYEPDMDGIVHIPQLSEDKGEGDAVWLTVLDLAALDFVAQVIIGQPESEGRVTMSEGVDGHGIREGQVWRRKRDGKPVRVIDWQASRGHVGLWWPTSRNGMIGDTGRETWKRAKDFVREFRLEGGEDDG